MSNQKAAQPGATRRRWRGPGVGCPAFALLLLTWTGAPDPVRADTIVLKSGEVIEGSIIDATRNTVVVQRAIGGMRQMPLRDIEEVRVELAQGQRISGQLLGWADGVYEIRSSGQVVRISAGDVVSRETATSVGQPPSNSPSRPLGPQTVRMAAAPATSSAAPTAAPEPEDEDRAPAAAAQEKGPAAEAGATPAEDAERTPAADEDRRTAAAAGPSPAGGGDRGPPAAKDQGPPAVAQRSLAAVEEDQARPAVEGGNPPAGKKENLASDQQQRPPAGERQNLDTEQRQNSPARGEQSAAAAGEGQARAAGERPTPAESQTQSAPAGAGQSLAAVDEDQAPATGAKQNLVIKASVDPAEPGAEDMVFRIELSRPAEQTVVLIYGTVEGTAKAGEDFEPQQGMVTLAPGSKSAEVRVPLIEQPGAEGEKRFELFLAADPKVAEVADQRIMATIKGGT